MDAEEKTNVDIQQICLSNNMLIMYYIMCYFRFFILYISFQMSQNSKLFFTL